MFISLGYIVDRLGKRATLTLVSSILAMFSFSSFYFTTPIISLTTLGVSYSIFASVLWPSVALVVNKKLVAFALGIMQSFQNLTLFISPIIVASIYSSTGSYTVVKIICLIRWLIIS